MTGFVLFFLLVYGGMNIYVLWSFRRAFELGIGASSLLGLLLVSLMAAPVLVRAFHGRAHPLLLRPSALLGDLWMAFAFWLVLLFAARDLWNLGARLAARFAPSSSELTLPLRGSALAFLALVSLAGLWGYYGAGQVRLRQETLRLQGLPAGSAPLRVLFFSDVHLDLLRGDRTLRRLSEIARATRPDLLLSGGDLVDAPAERRSARLRVLQGLEAPLGKYAVTGNHEYYAGIREAERFTKEAGFRLLKGATKRVGGRLLLVGVDDPAARQLDSRRTPTEAELLEPREDGAAVLLLKHRPVADPAALGRFDLQLSGHSHGGQIWPFRYLSRLVYPLPDGLVDVGAGSLLYKGLGTGTWGPPLRLFAPPEVTLFVLTPGS